MNLTLQESEGLRQKAIDEVISFRQENPGAMQVLDILRQNIGVKVRLRQDIQNKVTEANILFRNAAKICAGNAILRVKEIEGRMLQGAQTRKDQSEIVTIFAYAGIQVDMFDSQDTIQDKNNILRLNKELYKNALDTFRTSDETLEKEFKAFQLFRAVRVGSKMGIVTKLSNCGVEVQYDDGIALFQMRFISKLRLQNPESRV